MKFLSSTLVFCVLSAFAMAQTVVEISQGESYGSDVFVSMAEGEVATVDATTWDIAFNVVSGFSDGIRINDGQNAEISIYPNGTIEDWASVDTAGFSEWTRLWNGTTTWPGGALNQNYDDMNPFDFGWGIYTGDPDHDVLGDSLYVIQLVDGSHKKLRIDLLDNGNWTFTFANIDGTNEVTETFAMSDYPERNYVYYSITNESFVDREPSNLTWDMIFTRYYGMTSFGPGITAGVLSNDGVEVAQADGVNVDEAVWGDYPMIADDISIIGNDWKDLNEFFAWEVVADRCYFVKDLNGDVYKVIFTSFEGSSTGNISYTTELVSTSNTNELFDVSPVTNLYPNPVNSAQNINCVLDWNKNSMLNYNIFDVNGRVIESNTVSVSNGLSTVELPTQGLESGMYQLQIFDGQNFFTRSFIVK